VAPFVRPDQPGHSLATRIPGLRRGRPRRNRACPSRPGCKPPSTSTCFQSRRSGRICGASSTSPSPRWSLRQVIEDVRRATRR
jgi:hypothetical protein